MSAARRLPRHAPRSEKRRLRRRQWLHGLWTTGALALLAYGAWQSASIAADAPWLRISDVIVTGSQHVPAGDLACMADDLRGQNILQADLDGWRQRMLAWSWVDDVSMRRRLPSTVEVAIIERQPIGIARFGSDLLLVDASAVIDQYQPVYAEYDLPIIDGLFSGGDAGGVDARRGLRVRQLLDDVGRRPRIAARLSQIDVTDVDDVRVVLEGDAAVLRLGAAEFLQRLERYTRSEPAIQGRWATIDYADLRFGERVYVAPAQQAPR